MKKLVAIVVLAVSLTACQSVPSNTGTAAPTVAPTVAATAAPTVAAPTVAATAVVEPVVEPAPVLVEAPAVEAPAVLPAPARVYVAPAPAPAPVVVAPAPVQCFEDMPCWDCKTMGNLTCGSVAPVKGFTPTENPAIPPHSEGPFVPAPESPKCTTPAYEYVGAPESGQLLDASGQLKSEAVALNPNLTYVMAVTKTMGGALYLGLTSSKFCGVTYFYIAPR